MSTPRQVRRWSTPLPEAGRTALDNPRGDRVRAVAHLASAAGRRRAGQFLVEGPHAVTELLAAVADDPGRWRVAAVYATAEYLARPGVSDTLTAVGARPVEVSDRVLGVMADAASPQGVVAVVALPPRRPEPWRVPAVGGFGAVLVEVRDPGNVGTVVRAADAAGATMLALTTGCADPYSPKAVRAAAGSLFHVAVQPVADVPQVLDWAGRNGWQVLATAADGAVSLDDLSDAASAGEGPLTRPHLWLLGNEAHGLPPHASALADQVVRIPIRGRAESLNLAMAATLVLFASARRSGNPPPGGPAGG